MLSSALLSPPIMDDVEGAVPVSKRFLNVAQCVDSPRPLGAPIRADLLVVLPLPIVSPVPCITGAGRRYSGGIDVTGVEDVSEEARCSELSLGMPTSSDHLEDNAVAPECVQNTMPQLGARRGIERREYGKHVCMYNSGKNE